MSEAWKKRDHDETSELTMQTDVKRLQHTASAERSMSAIQEENSAFSRLSEDDETEL